MLEALDPVLLSRIQFGFVVAFHIIFPAFTIGLASWLALMEYMWLRTNKPVYKEVYLHWVKIFAVAFGMGVVSGVVMSYQFGTNWAVFSHKAGNVLGPLLAYEVLTAFFLEASFLGIMLFGWNKVGPRLHFLSTCLVAFGTLFSAFWILSANSWMQTPAGFMIDPEGVFYPTNWFEIVFNPSFPYRFVHMALAAYLTTAFVVGGFSAWALLKKQSVKHARVAFGCAMIIAVSLPFLQSIAGHASGINTYHHQPAKLAAMEGLFETEKGAGLHLFGIPNEKLGKTEYPVVIPDGLSLILTGDPKAEVKGLNDFPREEWPPSAPIFFSFRIMVGVAVLMMITGVWAIVLHFKKTLFENKLFHRWCVLMTPMGFVGIISGWITTEVGRQPYVVYNHLRTMDAASALTHTQVSISLLMFIVVYTIVFSAGIYYILRLVMKGPKETEPTDTYGTHGLKKVPNLGDVL